MIQFHRRDEVTSEASKGSLRHKSEKDTRTESSQTQQAKVATMVMEPG